MSASRVRTAARRNFLLVFPETPILMVTANYSARALVSAWETSVLRRVSAIRPEVADIRRDVEELRSRADNAGSGRGEQPRKLHEIFPVQ